MKSYEHVCSYNDSLYMFPLFNGVLTKSKIVECLYKNEDYNEDGFVRLDSIWYDNDDKLVHIKLGAALPLKARFNEFELSINAFGIILDGNTFIIRPSNISYAYEIASWNIWIKTDDQKLIDFLKPNNKESFNFRVKFNVELSVINERDWYVNE